MDFLNNIDFGELFGKIRDLIGKIDWGDLFNKAKPAFGKVADFMKKTPGILVALTMFLTVLADPVAGSTSGLTYAQAYALGLFDAEKPAADVTPTIELKDGNVIVSIDADAKPAYKVMLSVYESAAPIAASAETGWTLKKTYQLGADEEAAAFEHGSAVSGFYKVAITIENAAE